MRTPQSKVDPEGRVHVFDLQVPLVLALGWYEDLTDDQLREHILDLLAEVRRRNA